jgi:Protein of unknown function (DUF3575)
MPVLLWSQESNVPTRFQVPKVSIRTNMLTLINVFQQSYGVGAEVRIARRWSFDVNGGAFFGAIPVADNVGESYRGLRWRSTLKYYYYLSEKCGFYAGIEGKYNNIDHRSYKNISRQGGQFNEIKLIQRDIIIKGGNVGSGLQWCFGPKQRFVLDTYLGFGMKERDISIDFPPDAELLGFFRSLTFERAVGVKRVPDLVFNVSLGIAIW